MCAGIVTGRRRQSAKDFAGANMFTTNPFSQLSHFVPPFLMQIYVVLMIVAVAVGTLFDAYHKGSAKFLARRREQSNAAAEKDLSSGETLALALETIAEA